MSESVLRWAEPVLRDLAASGVDAPVVSIDPPTRWPFPPDGDTVWATMPGWGTVGAPVPRESDLDTLLFVTETIQELVIEHYGPAGGSNWPVCPAHPASHPLEAEVVGGEVVWTCPRDQTVVSRVGELEP